MLHFSSSIYKTICCVLWPTHTVRFSACERCRSGIYNLWATHTLRFSACERRGPGIIYDTTHALWAAHRLLGSAFGVGYIKARSAGSQDYNERDGGGLASATNIRAAE